jgi:hypothetical protein
MGGGGIVPPGSRAVAAVSKGATAGGAEQRAGGRGRVGARAAALLSTFTQAAQVVDPALAGGLTALVGPGWVIGAERPASPC